MDGGLRLRRHHEDRRTHFGLLLPHFIIGLVAERVYVISTCVRAKYWWTRASFSIQLSCENIYINNARTYLIKLAAFTRARFVAKSHLFTACAHNAIWFWYTNNKTHDKISQGTSGDEAFCDLLAFSQVFSLLLIAKFSGFWMGILIYRCIILHTCLEIIIVAKKISTRLFFSWICSNLTTGNLLLVDFIKKKQFPSFNSC